MKGIRIYSLLICAIVPAYSSISLINGDMEDNALSDSGGFTGAASPPAGWVGNDDEGGITSTLGDTRALVNEDFTGIAWLQTQNFGASVPSAVGSLLGGVTANLGNVVEIDYVATRRLNQGLSINHTVSLYAGTASTWQGGTALASFSVISDIQNRTRSDPGSFYNGKLFLSVPTTYSGSETNLWLVFQNDLSSSENAQMQFDNVTASVAIDSEPDGMPDSWETANGLIVGTNDASGDPDGDNLSNLEEFQVLLGDFGASTDPQDADTDDDQLTDGEEVKGTLNVYEEGFVAGSIPAGSPGAATNPHLSDSDEDGLTDYQEVNGFNSSSVSHGFGSTNPKDPFTDTDSMGDLYEADTMLDPTSASGNNGDSGDPDSDNLDNSEEAELGTNPLLADTDDDGLNDDVEDLFGTWDSSNLTGTDPLNPDSDGDGLKDGDENPDLGTLTGPIYPSDPNIFDTDSDGFDDGLEVAEGTDPSDDSDFPASLGTYITIVSETISQPEGISGTFSNGILLSEDLLMYTDRTHEHNGVDSNGIPSELLGGDYVAFANDTKNVSNYSAQITTQESTTLYLLVDERVTLPAWLSDGVGLDFADTGLTTGMDSLGSGSGAGNGNIQTFTVLVAQDTTNGNSTILPVDDYGIFELPTSLNFYSVIATAPVEFPLLGPSAPSIVSCGFNGTAFEVVGGNLEADRSYNLVRSSDLESFPIIVDSITDPTTIHTFTDADPLAIKGFYRIEEEL